MFRILKPLVVSGVASIASATDCGASGADFLVTEYPAANGTTFLAVGDINSDGYLDVVASHGFEAQIKIFYNNGNSGFHPGVDLLNGNPAGGSFNIKLVDLDSDGDLDILSGASWYKGIGGGEFASRSPLGIDASCSFFETGDFNGDGLLDLACVDSLWVQSDSGFIEVSRYWEIDMPYQMASGDLDGDGDLDLAIVDRGESVVLLENDGEGHMAIRGQVTGITAHAVEVADFDGDGLLDIASASLSDYLSIYINKSNWQFGAEMRYPAGDGPRELAVGDIDNDGYLDIAISNFYSDDISVFFGLENGLFDADFRIVAGDENRSVLLEDIDRDQDDDILVAALGGDSLVVIESRCSEYCAADLDGSGVLDLADIGIFTDGFLSGASVADLALPIGVLDLSDVGVFIASFLGGCEG